MAAPAMASFSPSPVIVLMPFRGEAATTSCPRSRRMATVFDPIRPVPPITTIFMVILPNPATRSCLKRRHHNMTLGFLTNSSTGQQC